MWLFTSICHESILIPSHTSRFIIELDKYQSNDRIHETEPTPIGANVTKRQPSIFMPKGATPSMADNQ